MTSAMDVDDDHFDAATAGQEIQNLWKGLQDYATNARAACDSYLPDAIKKGDAEQLRGLLDWTRRTKGSYESKLWEMDVLLNHIKADTNTVGYLGYDTDEHPDVSVVNRKAQTAVAIEIKQVESLETKQVHDNVYSALDQLFKRVYFDQNTPYTTWKAYVYVNSGNPWPWTKAADATKDYKTLIAEKAAEQRKTGHWTQWTGEAKKQKKSYKIAMSIWHADYGRADYELNTG